MEDRPGFRTVAYFVNWAIYARNHNPQEIPADKLTHVLYAFANVRPDTGEVYLTDSWSDVEKHYPSDSWNEPTPGPHIYGCLKQFALHKRRNRNLKILLSIGGWTYSSNFAPAAATSAGRHRFAESALQLVKDCGFDGLDVDWEYPQNDTEASNYVELLRVTRRALDEYAVSRDVPKNQFLLTVASPAGPEKFRIMRLKEMDKYLDFWNLMAYDFAGSWDTVAGHHANIYVSPGNMQATPFSAKAAVAYYVGKGVRRDKIVLGCPLYGRSFVGTEGPGHVYTGGVGEGSWEAGVWDWKVLPPASPSVRVLEDLEAIASWSYDGKTKTMISFDSFSIVGRKVWWVKDQALGGMMWWETSGDKKQGEGSAIETAAYGFGNLIEKRRNLISFPDSKYQNMRDGFPGEG